MADLMIVEKESAVSLLEAVCDLNETREAQLPIGRRVLVMPMDGMQEPEETVDDEQLPKQIRRSAEEFAAGKFKPFER